MPKEQHAQDPVEGEVHRVSLTDQVISVLRKEIFTGKYKPGDKLPPERDLAERFRISRSTLRKALLLLAQEGWIEVVQGRANTVKDFRTSVGIEVLPDLFFSCPEAVVSLDLLETMVENSAWLYQQIFTAAARKARPGDEEHLLELLARQTEDISIVEFYENEFSMFGELLRIGGNLVLQMTYNSNVRLARKLLASGIVKVRPYLIERYHEINGFLIQAVGAGDEEAIRKFISDTRPEIKESFLRVFREMEL